MEPLLICCLMAHRSRKNGSPTVSWEDGGCRQGLRPRRPPCLPRLPLHIPAPRHLAAHAHQPLPGCLAKSLRWGPGAAPLAPGVSMDPTAERHWPRAAPSRRPSLRRPRARSRPRAPAGRGTAGRGRRTGRLQSPWLSQGESGGKQNTDWSHRHHSAESGESWAQLGSPALGLAPFYPHLPPSPARLPIIKFSAMS